MTEASFPVNGNETARRELVALRAEAARLGEALREAERREACGRDALTVERLRHEGDLAAARAEAAAAQARLAAVTTELDRVLADDRAAALAMRESGTDYRALFDARDDGSCIVEVLFDLTGRAEDYRFLEVNVAFERQTGLRGAVGRRARELASTLEEHWFETCGRVALTGEAVRFVNNAAALGNRWYDVCAFRIGQPGQHRVVILFTDITGLRLAEGALREGEARQAFLLTVADALRPLADPAEIEGEACRLLAERLAVDRAYYVELDEAAGTAQVARDFVRGDAPSLAGQHRITDFAWSVAILRRGECHVVADTQAASDLVPPADRPACAALGIIACMGAPLIKDGRLIGALCVTAARPRAWTRDEVELLREVGERAWAAIERVRAGTRLRESEAWLAGEKEAFQAAASGAPLAVALAALIRTAAAQLGGGAGCAFYVADREAAVLRQVAGRPDAYAECGDGCRIGADSLACGLAAHTGQPVITPDVTREPRWRPWLWMAEKHGYRGCWSFPIETLEGRVVGTFAAHFPTERTPATRDLDLAAVLARAAAVIIARHQEAEDRIQVEAALRASEERFRGFAENSADVLWITNGDGSRLEYLSPAFERIFGEPRARILADLGRFMELVHLEDRGELSRYLPQALAGEVAVAHYRVVRPSDGRVVHLRDTGFPIRDANGAVVRAAGIVQDVSDLHEAAAAREAEKERFRTLAEGLPQLVWRAAPNGRWTWASPQWKAYTGQTEAGSAGDGWLAALHPADRATAGEAWDAAERLGVYQADFRVRHAGTGYHAWFQTRGVPLRDAGGALVEWIGACANIDEQVRARETLARSAEELDERVRQRTAELLAAEAALHQAQKMEAIGQLTGGIAHDFNNMLQGVVGGLDMARRRLDAGRSADVARYTDAARDAAVRAAGLTRRLLAFARRQQLQPRPLDPNALVRGMEELLRRSVGPAVAVELRLRDGAGHVLCDPSELESAVLNLCINARDAMRGGGRLTIATDSLQLSVAEIAPHEGAAPGEFVSIRVTDTGTGMMPEILAHVLEPFFTTKPQGEGTGLGLSQVYGFVRQSGGLLRLDSAPGRGTTVQILLPRREPEPASAGPEATGDMADRAGHGETVLMVDDETTVRMPAAERLRDLGYRVVEAGNGPEAVRLLEEGLRPDILVTDVGLPNGMDGRAVAKELERRWPGLPVVFATGYAHVALPDDAMVVTKPFDLDTLAARIVELRRRIR